MINQNATTDAGLAVEVDPHNKKVRLILDAASKLFLEQGYDPTSTEMIAREAGVSKATLYVYFPMKEALLVPVVRAVMRSIKPMPLWDRPHGPVDAEAGLRQIATRFVAIFMTDQGMALERLIMSCKARFPEVGKTFFEEGPRRVQSETADFLHRAEKEGSLIVPDIDLAATQFIALVRGDLPLTRALGLDLPAKSELEKMIEGGIRVFIAAYGPLSTGFTVA